MLSAVFLTSHNSLLQFIEPTCGVVRIEITRNGRNMILEIGLLNDNDKRFIIATI
jgi:hypothetical protein